MTQTEQEALGRALVDALLNRLGVGLMLMLVVVFVAAYLGLRHWLVPLLTQAAQISAEKAAAGWIAHAQEAAKAPFAIDAENRRARHELRTAALDRRLEVHQQAFAHWRRLVVAMQTSGLPEVEKKCDDWWYDNCLYLEPEIRVEFKHVVICAGEYKRQSQVGGNTSRLEGAFDRVAAFGDKVLSAMTLPPLGQEIYALTPAGAVEG